MLFFLTQAQDKILMKNGDEFNAWIIEQSECRVKFRLINQEDSPLINLKTKKVESITYRNGTVMNFKPSGIRMEKRFGINAGLMYGLDGYNYGIIVLKADYFLTPWLNLEANYLSFLFEEPGMSIGANYYFNPYRNSPAKGFAGMRVGNLANEFFLQFPVGLSYTSQKGFDLKLAISGLTEMDFYNFYLFSELSVGWRF
jgi:hypothetical protein